MKFVGMILRIKSFWTAFALSLIFVAIFSDKPEFCPMSPIDPESVRETTKPVKFVSSEDYAVFSAVMDQRMSSRETFVIGNQAFDEAPENYPTINRSSSRASGETISDYITNNKEPRLLKNLFELRARSLVVLLSPEENDQIFVSNEAGWDNFFERYPNSSGIIHFSNVGFNREKTEALVRIKYLCALCSDKQTFYLLTKQGEHWRVVMQ